MIRVAEFYAGYRSTVPESELSVAGENLLQFAENAAREYYAERYDQLGISVSVRLEIGSTRVWITIKMLGKAFLFYATIRQGVDYLIQDSQNLASRVIPAITTQLKIPPERPRYHARRLGLPGQLRRLFEKVQRGELSPDEATNQAVLLFQRQEGDAMQEVPGLREKLSLEFRNPAPPSSRIPGDRHGLDSQSAAGRGSPRRAPSLPRRREPVVAPLPGTESRRRRRRGIIATRDPETGNIRVTPY